ncbi:MAG: universal stress protein [Acidihalobacter sp.]|jgi:nucleotide-binding universal stress UspA family protein|uniref:universal stress protein n=1 Tax=Acidihalobacter sp. TaxID=1872108 RepID=UPI00307CFBF3
MSLYQRIIVPVDDSPAAMYGLQAALALAKDQAAQLKLFTVVDEASSGYAGGELGWIEPEGIDKELRSEARHLLNEAVASAEAAGLAPEQELIETPSGHTVRAIHQAASQWRADLMVIGTHGRHGMAHMLFGSTAEDVVRSPELPILVVPIPHAGEAQE